MKLALATLSALIFAAGCAEQQPAAPSSVPAAKPVKAAATAVHEAPTLAPEQAYKKALVLGADSAKGCTWIQSEALITAGGQDTRDQLHAAAVSEAEKNAMQDFLGVEVNSRSLDFMQASLRGQETLNESLLQTTRRGRILDEAILEESFRDIAGCPGCRYFTKLKTCIVPIADNSDKQFHAELGISRTNFVEGDEAKITVTASRDCYVYLYDVDPDKNTSLIIPNEIAPEVKLRAGESWEYPNAEARKKGVKLVAQLPPGKDVSAETIRLVVSKTKLPSHLEDPAAGGYLSLLRRLTHSNLEWTEDAQAFTIRKH